MLCNRCDIFWTQKQCMSHQLYKKLNWRVYYNNYNKKINYIWNNKSWIINYLVLSSVNFVVSSVEAISRYLLPIVTISYSRIQISAIKWKIYMYILYDTQYIVYIQVFNLKGNIWFSAYVLIGIDDGLVFGSFMFDIGIAIYTVFLFFITIIFMVLWIVILIDVNHTVLFLQRTVNLFFSKLKKHACVLPFWKWTYLTFHCR